MFEGPATVAAVIMEPVQNAGGCFTPPEGYFQRIREICDEFDVLMISDEVICSWGRLGTWFGAQRYDYQPDVITTAKGITGAIAPLGAMIVSDRVAAPFMEGGRDVPARLHVRRAPDLRGGRARRRSTPTSARRSSSTCARTRAPFRAMLESLRDIPIVGDVRGAGYFHAIELVKDRDTKETFDDDEAETLLRGFLSGELFRRGLICRADDRGDPVDPAVAAADRRARAVRGDRGRAAAGARRGDAPHARAGAAAMARRA